MSASTWATITTILAAVFLASLPVAYYFGRRSSIEDAMDRLLAKQTRLPAVNPQKAQGAAESRAASSPEVQP